MRALPASSLLCVAAALCPGLCAADVSAAPTTTAAPPAGQGDRLMLSASGSRLTGTSGGGGGLAGWLHEVNPRALIGVMADYQTIADSHWTFGSLIGALTGGGQPSQQWSLSGELHEGSGRIGTHAFDYSIASVGFSHALTDELSLQLEERQIDVDTTHGSLPKVGLSMLWNRQWLAVASYANSVGGNLGTDLGTVRVDYFRQTLDILAGGAVGRIAPAVVNLQGAVQPGAKQMREVFVGVSQGYSRADWMLLADYLDVSGSKRITLTLNCTVHMRAFSHSR